VYMAVGHGGCNLYFNEYLFEIVPPVTFAPELLQDIREREVVFLAFIEQPDRCLALLRVKLHLRHDGFSGGDLGSGYLAISLGNMTHDGKGGREKGGLDTLLLAYTRAGILIRYADAAVEIASQRCTQQRTQRATEHEAEGAAKQCSPPGHQGSTRRSGPAVSREGNRLIIMLYMPPFWRRYLKAGNGVVMYQDLLSGSYFQIWLSVSVTSFMVSSL